MQIAVMVIIGRITSIIVLLWLNKGKYAQKKESNRRKYF